MKYNFTLFLLLFLCSCASGEKNKENSERTQLHEQFRLDIGGSQIR